MNDSQLDKAIDFIKNGGAISAIESKYSINSVQMAELDIHLKERNE